MQSPMKDCSAIDGIKEKVRGLLNKHKGLLYSTSSSSEQILTLGKACLADLEKLANEDIDNAVQDMEDHDDLPR